MAAPILILIHLVLIWFHFRSITSGACDEISDLRTDAVSLNIFNNESTLWAFTVPEISRIAPKMILRIACLRDENRLFPILVVNNSSQNCSYFKIRNKKGCRRYSATASCPSKVATAKWYLSGKGICTPIRR